MADRRLSGAVAAAVARAPVAIASAVILTAALLVAAFEFAPLGPATLFMVTGLLAAIAGHLIAGPLTAAVLAGTAALATFFAGPLWVEPYLLMAACVPFALVAGTLRQPADDGAAWRVGVRVGTAVLFGLFVAALVVGAVALLAAVGDLLLELSLNQEPLRVTAPVAFGLVGPVVMLALIGGDERGARLAEAVGVVVQALGKLLLLPVVAAYAVLVYVYLGRIAVSGEVPSGEVGWIVSMFGVAAVATSVALAGDPTPGRAVRVFRAACFPLMLAPLAVLAWSLWLRVAAYGLTADRVVLLLATVWLGILAIAFTLSRTRDVRLIPLTLALVLALGSAGPWSAVPLIVRSQGEQIAAALQNSAPTPDDRRALCSAIGALAKVRPEAAALASGGRTGASCEADANLAGVEIRTLVGATDVLKLSQAATVWRPRYALYSDAPEQVSYDGRFGVRAEGGVLVVRNRDTLHRFDLAAVGAERRGAAAETVVEPLHDGEVTVVVNLADVTITAAGTTLGRALVTVVAID